MQITTAAIVERESGLVESSVGDDLVILSMPGSAYVTLDQVGRRIWALTEQPITVADLVSSLQEDYADDDGRIEDDVIAFLVKIREDRLITVQ